MPGLAGKGSRLRGVGGSRGAEPPLEPPSLLAGAAEKSPGGKFSRRGWFVYRISGCEEKTGGLQAHLRLDLLEALHGKVQILLGVAGGNLGADAVLALDRKSVV